MNTAYMVTYDLSQPDRDYEKVKELMKSQPHWAHVLESVWFVKTSLSANQLAQKVRSCVDQSDHFIVSPVDISGSCWFNLDAEVSDWLQRPAA